MYIQVEYKKERHDFWGVKFFILEDGRVNLTLGESFEGVSFFKFPKGAKIITAFPSNVTSFCNNEEILKFADKEFINK
jgi:hypothetical protein